MIQLQDVQKTEFKGYDSLAEDCQVMSILKDGNEVNALDAGSAAIIILNHTPFYGESGGQVGDSGELLAGDTRFVVNDTQKQSDVFLHIGQLESGTIKVGDKIYAHVNEQRRQAIKLNHSATHLMHEALRKVLGDHVQQKGSLVDSEKLRFDFSHFQPMTETEIRQIEGLANAIREIIEKPEEAKVRTEKAREYIIDNLSLDKQIGQYEKLYLEAVS